MQKIHKGTIFTPNILITTIRHQNLLNYADNQHKQTQNEPEHNSRISKFKKLAEIKINRFK